MKTSVVFIVICLLGSILVLSGCTTNNTSDTQSNSDNEQESNNNNVDPVIIRSEPYLDKIVSNDLYLRSYANSIISSCPDNDKECQIDAIYRYIVENFNYISDPVDVELIQYPNETIQIKGGDCEDLSILLISLLENIGIDSFLVLTDNHAYALASDVDVDNLWIYVEESLINQVEKDFGDNIRSSYDSTFVINAYNSWYYGGDGSSFEEEIIDYMDISYNIESNKPLNLNIVPSRDDFNKLNAGETYTHYPNCEENNILKVTGKCSYLNQYGGIILVNNNWQDATVHVNLSFYLHPSFYKIFENNTITYYNLEGEKCVVLDATAGEYGYPGFDSNLEGEKIAINPISREYFNLK